jgi:F0F1-type ATP synthase assembly protein I
MPDDKKQRDLQQALYASSIGWMFPIAIALGYLWGWGMDYLFHTTWLRYLFAAFGIVAAFINLFRIGLAGDGTDTGDKPPQP